MPKTNEEWKAWGERDPMYGVAAWSGRQRSGQNPWTEDEFYKLGESDWVDFKSRWERYGRVNYDSVAEIGCGAGRITNQLAAFFKKVLAIDVSEGMIEFAQEKLRHKNIEWVLAEGPRLPIESATISAVFSCQTFQHLESEEAVHDYFRESFRILEPGGTMFIHIPVHFLPIASKPFARMARYLYPLFIGLEVCKGEIARFRMRLGGRPHMHVTSIEDCNIFQMLRQIGYVDIEIVAFLMTSNSAMHSCVLATKPSTELSAA